MFHKQTQLRPLAKIEYGHNSLAPNMFSRSMLYQLPEATLSESVYQTNLDSPQAKIEHGIIT